ncbi:MAG: MarR family transcriptional regulator [Eggerthellaceae bacterium]|jgi:DNA-binding MarR family transcriptional regulator|nr:MarR family transcriptional regulator [Eggerthellaceae bacterium]MCH4221512.1 MarR family transcriptional regulator [Eggerthellaceae bacterium]
MKSKPEWFIDVYEKFKLHFYREVFNRFQGREASLTTTETFCVDIIHDLNRPTIHEFADFAHISAPNAAYKVNNLIKKGYISKVQSDVDRREYHLEVTDRYTMYHQMSCSYVEEVIDRVRKRFESKDIDTFEKILCAIATELTPEIDIPLKALGGKKQSEATEEEIAETLPTSTQV